MANVNDSAAVKRLKQARLSFKTKENKSGCGDKTEESLPVKKTSIAAKLARFAASPLPPPDEDAESTPQPTPNSNSKSAEEVILLSDDSNSVSICEPNTNDKKDTESCVLEAQGVQIIKEKSDSDEFAKSEVSCQINLHEGSLLESLEDSDYAESVSNDSDNPNVAEAYRADKPPPKETNQLSCDGEDNSEEKSADVNDNSKNPKANKKSKPKNTTPKMLEKETERQRKREEKQLEKEEKQREKEEKERLKAEAKAHKEFLKKQKQEALEVKAALKKKAEEEKEQEKKQRAEEKQRIEEEKKRQEEEERKKKERVSQAFASFFTPKAKKTQPVCVTIASSRKLAFEPFQIKAGMRLASILRTSFPEERKNSLTALLNDQTPTSPTYLAQLKSSQYRKGKSSPTWPLSKETDEVEVIDDEEAIVVAATKASVVVESDAPCKEVRAKLLQFHENRRPPYWGTWSKKPSHINPRRPFAKEDVFDYEVDSDDEWEEEEPGESVSDSDGEEKEPEDDYEVDNEFFVPHGYLSDEEAIDDNDEVMSPERMKASLKAKEAEFEEERKKKTCHLKARLIGCIWMDQVESNPDLQQVLKVLNPYRAVPCVSVPISLSQVNAQKYEDGEGAEDKKSESKKVKKKAFSDKDLPDLVRLFHGNMKNKKFLVKEFRTYLLQKYSAPDDGEPSAKPGKDLGENGPRYSGPSVTAIENKASEIAEWKHCNELSGTCWVVKTEVLESCGLADQSATNSWQYVLPVKRKRKTPIGDVQNSKTAEDSVREEETESSKPKAKVSLIKQFMQPSTAPQKEAGSKSSESKPKKRVQLIPLAPVNKKPKLDTETVTLD